jgi:hypothetical protein
MKKKIKMAEEKVFFSATKSNMIIEDIPVETLRIEEYFLSLYTYRR